MRDDLSVFYANARRAAEESGEPLLQVLEEIKKAGITALDFDAADLADGLPEEADAAGLKVNSIYSFLPDLSGQTAELAEKQILLAEKYGAVMMFVPAGADRGTTAALKTCASADEIKTCADASPVLRGTAALLERLAVFGEARGVPVCVENFDSHTSLTERKAELQWLFESAPHLKFNADTGNSVTCGEDIRELCALFADRIVNVHCKDRMKKDGAYRVCPVGSGEMPIGEIKKNLMENGYKGRFSVEVFDVRNTLDAIRSSAEYLGKN